MLEGSTVIYNDEYISELNRFIDINEEKLSHEVLPEARAKLEDTLRNMYHKLDDALEFREVVEELINVEVPRIAAVKTISGRVIPVRNLQVV